MKNGRRAEGRKEWEGRVCAAARWIAAGNGFGGRGRETPRAFAPNVSPAKGSPPKQGRTVGQARPKGDE